MKWPRWISVAEALALHNVQVATFGGPAGVRDQGLLESALARPQNIYAYEPSSASLARLAAAYAFGIVANHPFVDGNKRTGLVVAFAFLDLNGMGVAASEEEVYSVFMELAAGTIKEEQLTLWLNRVSGKNV